MYNSKVIISLFLFLGIILSACSSIQFPGLSKSTSSQANTTTNLAVGTLALEESSLNITQEQATQLLPLWKAVKSLGSDSLASTAEINALYDQIEETMSSDQVQAIQQMSQADLTAAMQKYQIAGGAGQAPQGQAPQGNPPAASADTASSAGAEMSSSSMLESGGSVDTTMMDSAQTTTTSATSSTPSTTRAALSTNVRLASQVIDLLQQRANAVTA
jgi:hypothetical protein